MSRPVDGSIALVRHAVVIGERLAVVSHGDSTSGESHHAHALTSSTSTTEQVHLVVKHMGEDGVDVSLVASLDDHVELLAKLLVDVSRLLEVRHLGDKLVEADARTGDRVRIKSGSLQHDGKTTGTLDPRKLETTLLVIGEQLFTGIRSLILRQSLPVSRKLRSLNKIEDIH